MTTDHLVARLVSAIAICGALIAPIGASQAQTAANAGTGVTPAPADQAPPADVGQLQEVVVTAERRATDVQNTPIAVTAVSGEQLQTLHLDNISSLQSTVPSFQSADQGGFFNSINIRGMGNSAISPAIATGVLVFRDGLPMWETIAEDEPMFDIADTEVLEGPQGTFVGGSSTAGAVEINSVNPNFNGLNGYVLAAAGSYSDNKYQGAINLPISDTFAARFAFNEEKRHSFYKDIGSTQAGYYFTQYTPTFGTQRPLDQGVAGQGQQFDDPGHFDSTQYRVKLLWKPTDNFQALGDIEYSFIGTGGEPAEPNPGAYQSLFTAGSSYGACTGATPGGTLLCPAAGATAHSTFYYPGEKPFVLDYLSQGMTQEDELLTHYSLELKYTLPGGIQLRSLSGFVHIDINHQTNVSYGPQYAGWMYHQIGPNDNYDTQELDVLSPTTGKINWVGGAFWAYRDTPVMTNTDTVPASSQWQPSSTPSTETFTANSTVARIAAVFGQFNWQLTNTLQLQIGARDNWDNNFIFNEVATAPSGNPTLQNPNGTGTYSIINGATCTGLNLLSPCYKVLTNVPSSGASKDTKPTGKVDLNWTPIPGQNFYAFYARGYKPGGSNAGSLDHPTFTPEAVNDWELGWKGRLLSGHMLTQVGGYYVNYQNMQYPLEDVQAANDTTLGAYTANLAPTKLYGVEISEQSRFGGLGVNLGLGWSHSALGAVTTLPFYALPAGFGSPTAVPQCLAGHTYSTTPGCFNYNPYLVSLSGEQNPLAPTWTGNLSVDYLFHVGIGTIDPRMTYSYTSTQYSSIFEIPYNNYAARHLLSASVDYVLNKWDLQVYGTNLTNQIYAVGTVSGGASIYYGPPRQVGFQAIYRF